MVFSIQCADPRQPIDPPHSFSAAPLFRGRLLPVFGFFAGMQKGTPTRAPQVVMRTRPGCFPEITCEQLAVFRKTGELERRDAEIVFLTCPALSEEAGRKLPKPVERSLLSDLTLRYLEGREKNRRWAEEKVRQDPDSPALYLFTRWWEAVRGTHEARRMMTLTKDQPGEAYWEAAALCDAALEEEHARFYALEDSCQLT